MSKLTNLLVSMLIAGLIGTVGIMSSVIHSMRDEVSIVRADLNEHIHSALYYMEQFNQMRNRFERANGSRVARQLEKLDGN